MLVNKLGVDVLLLMLRRLRFCKSFQSDNYVWYDLNNGEWGCASPGIHIFTGNPYAHSLYGVRLITFFLKKYSSALRHGSQRSLKCLICIFENQLIPSFTIFRIMYLFKTL